MKIASLPPIHLFFETPFSIRSRTGILPGPGLESLATEIPQVEHTNTLLDPRARAEQTVSWVLSLTRGDQSYSSFKYNLHTTLPIDRNTTLTSVDTLNVTVLLL